MGTSVTLQQSNYETEEEKRCVFRFDLKTCKVLDDVTSDDRLFHVFALAIGKAWSPIENSREVKISNRIDFAHNVVP